MRQLKRESRGVKNGRKTNEQKPFAPMVSKFVALEAQLDSDGATKPMKFSNP